MRLERLAVLIAATTTAGATELAPYTAQRVDLAGVSGVAYYVERPDGFHVVATLAEAEAGPPIRFEATLASGQKLTLSVPGKLGEATRFVEFVRAGDRLLVEESRQSPLLVAAARTRRRGKVRGRDEAERNPERRQTLPRISLRFIRATCHLAQWLRRCGRAGRRRPLVKA